MEAVYFIAEIKKNRRRQVFIIELEGRETIEEVVERNFGPEASIVNYRVPTPEELILMRRTLKT